MFNIEKEKENTPRKNIGRKQSERKWKKKKKKKKKGKVTKRIKHDNFKTKDLIPKFLSNSNWVDK